MASQWTEGKKTLLYIRIDFSDLQGEPISRNNILPILQQVDAYYQRVSYGKLSIKSTVTPTFRMPRTAQWYGSTKDHEQIIRDARSAAKAAGLDTAQFDLDIVAFKTKRGGDSGVGAVGGKGLRLLNNFRFGVTVHELGHNFGLPHTKLWKTSDGSIVGPGKSMDFGDPHDPMGGGGDDPRNHFSIRSKYLLGWLGTDGICNVTNSGTYRIHAQDTPSARGVRGLRIVRDAKTIYWVEFRQQIPENRFMMNGVRILRSYADNNELDLLDMTPDSSLGAKDAALLLGSTFTDKEAGIYIAPIEKSTTTPASLVVVVKLGQRPRN